MGFRSCDVTCFSRLRTAGARLAGRPGSRSGQVQRYVPAGAGEQPRTLAEDHRNDELVGPPAEQERAGALVGLGDQRPGLVVARPSAQPPRSNPFARSSSDAPPFPCTTPSTVTCVMVVSFMITVPFTSGALAGGLSPRHEHRCPDPTPPPGISAEDLPDAGCQRSGNATGSGRLRSTSSCAPGAWSGSPGGLAQGCSGKAGQMADQTGHRQPG